jgi:hypothetical protein
MKRIWLLCIFCAAAGCALGQELDPRSYAALPVNLNAIAGTFGASTGNILVGAALPIQNIDVTGYTGALGYVHTFGLLGKLARVSVGAPFAILTGTAQVNGRDTSGARSGFGDTRIRLSINLFGSPVLDKKQFGKYRQETVVGVSLIASVPTGAYYPSKLINIGSNRWGLKPEVGVSKRFTNLYLEVYAGTWFYTDNNDFVKGHVLSEDPVASLQGHAVYYFKNGMWLSADGNWFSGGQSYLNGVSFGADFDNYRAGGAWSVPVSKGQSVKLQFNAGAFTSRGYNYTTVSLAYEYVFF